MEAKLKKKKLLFDKKTIKELKQKVIDAVAQEEEAKKKARIAKEKVLWVVKDYKKSSTFENEMTEARAFSYEISFNDCKKKVKELFPCLDLGKVVDGEEDEDVVKGDEE